MASLQKKCIARKKCTGVTNDRPNAPFAKSHCILSACYCRSKGWPQTYQGRAVLGVTCKHVQPKNTFPWAWDSLNTRDTVSKRQEMGGNGCKGRPRTAQSALFLPGAGTHPYNHHLHWHMLGQPDGSSEMHGQSHQKVKNGNQILAMDGCREQGKGSK